jgi:methylenetetrahydrofolate reductase (NADPH)
MKIIDKINAAIEENRTMFSFEYFPPKTDEGVINLFERLDRMASFEPEWIDVTWGAGGSTAQKTLEICATAQKYCGLETMMHLTCTNMPRAEIDDALRQAKDAGIQNILALRGDPPRGEEWKKVEGGFAHAADLVRYIRAEYGDFFGICVAGYPEMHLDSESREKDLEHLKAKIDAGADFIITQLFYDTTLFLKFVKDCRTLGINCPIIPGMMPIQTYGGFKRMTSLCKTFIPEHINKALEPIQDDDSAVKKYGVDLCVQMCRDLLAAGTPGVHFYTLNLEKAVTQILEDLDLIAASRPSRALPWRSSAYSNRKEKEDVRPIFWANRPRSYMSRTASWDDFPNGRWGDSRSPAFGELKDWHLGSMAPPRSNYSKQWGVAPEKVEDIINVFVGHCEGKVTRLPWVDTAIAAETSVIQQQLMKINRAGFLTINSQPRVNAADSSDKLFGWGGPGGYVYQKEYLEFFCSPENKDKLLAQMVNFPTLSYHVVNVKGESVANTKGTAAVTWGVFPGKEVVQPTVVDAAAFLVWKDEAFTLWETQWGNAYEEGSVSRELIKEIHDTYFLVNIVDNNFISGNLFDIFDKVIDASTPSVV